MPKIARQDFIAAFQTDALDVATLRRAAQSAGAGDDVSSAIADAGGADGKIAGGAALDALFTAFDKFDHDGNPATITVDEHAAPVSVPGDKLSLLGALIAHAAASSTTSSGSGVTTRRSDLRFSGAGPIDITSKDNRVVAFRFTGGMNVDTDGGTSALSRSDPDFQKTTSLMWAGNHALDADRIPYIVLPPPLAHATGVQLGDLVEVSKGTKTAYAIYGDVGPSKKLGEGSLVLARVFDPHAGPNNGVDGGVLYAVLPGSGEKAGIQNGGPAKSADDIERAGTVAFAQARATGVLV